MRRTLPSFRNSRSLLVVCGAAVLAASWLFAPEARTQAPAAAVSSAVLNPLLAKLKTQQDQMVANQTKIEAQTAQLKEELRQAKIYSGRGGSRR